MKKKILTMIIANALIVSCISSSALATTTTTSTQKNISITNTEEGALKELSQSEIKHLDKYVELTKDGQFVFDESKISNKEEKEILKQYLDIANAEIQKVKESNNNVVVNTTKKTVTVTMNSNKMQLNSINSHKYSDYTITWSGVRVYLSHHCVSDMKDYTVVAVSAGGTLGTATVAFLTSLGIGSGVAAVFAGAGATAGVYMYTKITHNDQGHGVFIDVPFSIINNPELSIFLIKVQPYYEEA